MKIFDCKKIGKFRQFSRLYNLLAYKMLPLGLQISSLLQSIIAYYACRSVRGQIFYLNKV